VGQRDAGGHDADVGDHDRPIWVTTMLRSTCSRWAETRNQIVDDTDLRVGVVDSENRLASPAAPPEKGVSVAHFPFGPRGSTVSGRQT
jgi:hypothetical protein